MIGKHHRLHIAALVAALCLVVVPSVAQTQDVPSVAVRPAGTTAEDPGGGEWFVFELSSGQTGRARAQIFNPADVAQTVKLYLRDLVFSKNGSLGINDAEQTDVGSWGTVESSQLTIPAKGRVEVGFSITPRSGADPGDHVGVFVVESPPQGSKIRTIKRVATRIFVTIPGDAVRSFEIEKRLWDYGGLWPRTATLAVDLRNTGRIRLTPKVSVNGETAKGPNILLSRTQEKYFATVPVPWFGGPLRVSIEAIDESGLTRIASSSTFVVPWALLLIVSAVGITTWAGVRFWKKRRGRFEILQSQISRLEEILMASQLPQPQIERGPVVDVTAGIPSPSTPSMNAPAEKPIGSKPKRSYKAKGPGKKATVAKEKPVRRKARSG